MYILSKTIHRFSTIPIKIPMRYFTNIEQTFQKIAQPPQGSRTGKPFIAMFSNLCKISEALDRDTKILSAIFQKKHKARKRGGEHFPTREPPFPSRVRPPPPPAE